MRAFAACFKIEFKKLTLRKKYIVYTIISSLICVLFALVLALVGRAANITSGSVASGVPLTVMSVFTQVIMPLVATMAVCDLFAAEYRDMSIKAQLMRPVTRFKIYVGKLCAVLAICAVIFMCIYAVSAVADFIFSGNTSGIGYSFCAYLLNLITMIPIILLAAFINQLTKSSTSAMFLCIIVYILMKISGILVPVLDSLLPTGYLEWHKLWLGNMLPFGALTSKCVLLIGYGTVFFSGGYYLFLRREF